LRDHVTSGFLYLPKNVHEAANQPIGLLLGILLAKMKTCSSF